MKITRSGEIRSEGGSPLFVFRGQMPRMEFVACRLLNHHPVNSVMLIARVSFYAGINSEIIKISVEVSLFWYFQKLFCPQNHYNIFTQFCLGITKRPFYCFQ